MQYAVSMRYGGMLVHAHECKQPDGAPDYQAFVKWGLICLNCKESIYLVAERKEHERKHKGGSIKVAKAESYFGHRPDKEKSDVDRCELRDTALSPSDIAHADIVAKNQRLKIFHRAMWRILQTCYKLDRHQESVDMVRKGLGLALAKSFPSHVANHHIELFLTDLTKGIQSGLWTISRDIENVLAKIVAKIESNDPVVLPEKLKPLIARWQQRFDYRMHQQICKEAVDFLSRSQSYPLVEGLVLQGLHNFIVFQALSHNKGKAESFKLSHSLYIEPGTDNEFVNTISHVFDEIVHIDTQQFNLMLLWLRDDISEMIALVNWGDGFEAVESSINALQKKGKT